MQHEPFFERLRLNAVETRPVMPPYGTASVTASLDDSTGSAMTSPLPSTPRSPAELSPTWRDGDDGARAQFSRQGRSAAANAVHGPGRRSGQCALRSSWDDPLMPAEPLLASLPVELVRNIVAAESKRVGKERASLPSQARLNEIASALRARLNSSSAVSGRWGDAPAARQSRAPTVILGATRPVTYTLSREREVHAGANGVVVPLNSSTGARLMLKFFRSRAALEAELEVIRACGANHFLPIHDCAHLTDERVVAAWPCASGNGGSGYGAHGSHHQTGFSAHGGQAFGVQQPFATGYVISARGTSLETLIKRGCFAHGNLPHLPVELTLKTLSILSDLHDAGHIHGNLSPRHIISTTQNSGGSLPELKITDLSCARVANDQTYAPWGHFDVRFAAPEVVEAALMRSGAVAAPAADVWSFGVILYEATQARPYWPSNWSEEDVVEALLGRRPLPHVADEGLFFARNGAFRGIILRMLQPSAAKRAHVSALLREACCMQAASPSSQPRSLEHAAARGVPVHADASRSATGFRSSSTGFRPGDTIAQPAHGSSGGSSGGGSSGTRDLHSLGDLVTRAFRDIGAQVTALQGSTDAAGREVRSMWRSSGAPAAFQDAQQTPGDALEESSEEGSSSKSVGIRAHWHNRP